MPSPVLTPATASPSQAKARKLFGRWWRRQSPARQDRFATLGPLLSVLLFLAAIISAFWYLRNEEIERETESVKRDTELTQQQIGMRLLQNQETLIRIARGLGPQQADIGADSRAFAAQAAAFTRERPEITHLSWVNARRSVQANHWAQVYNVTAAGEYPTPALPVDGKASAPEAAFVAARQTRTPAYSRAFMDGAGTPVFQIHIPLIERGAFAGTLIAEYSVEALLRHFVPADVAQRHVISVIDERQAVLGLQPAAAAHAGHAAARPVRGSCAGCRRRT